MFHSLTVCRPLTLPKAAALGLALALGFASALTPSVAAARGDDGASKEEGERVNRKTLPPEPKAQQDFTAYTVGHKQWRLGLINFDYGLLDELSIGTSPLKFIVGPNVRAKVMAVERGRFALGLQAGYWRVNQNYLAGEDAETSDNAKVSMVPLEYTVSWWATPKFSLHVGNTWTLAQAKGKFTGEQIGNALATLTQDGSGDSIGDAVDDSTYVGADIRVSAMQSNAAAEWRFNRKHSLVLVSRNTVLVSGVIAGTAGAADEESGVEVGAGIGATFSVPVSEAFSTSTSLSWQWSKERFNLRLGIPLSKNPLAFVQALEMYWLLGPTPEPTVLPPPRERRSLRKKR